jgi:hypothetical protein
MSLAKLIKSKGGPGWPLVRLCFGLRKDLCRLGCLQCETAVRPLPMSRERCSCSRAKADTDRWAGKAELYPLGTANLSPCLSEIMSCNLDDIVPCNIPIVPPHAAHNVCRDTTAEDCYRRCEPPLLLAFGLFSHCSVEL